MSGGNCQRGNSRRCEMTGGVGEGLCPGGSYPGKNCPWRIVLEPNLRSNLYVLINLLYCVKEIGSII